MNTNHLFESVIDDFAALAADYQRAGLFDDRDETSAPANGIVERAQRLVFIRAFLWTYGILRNHLTRELQGGTDRVAHVTVFGGTKTGKSTCVNVLLGVPGIAVPHHLGGFTRHAQAFVPPNVPDAALFGGNPYAFLGFRRMRVEDLRDNVFDEYGVKRLGSQSKLGKLVVWDAPDCDAVGSSRYMSGLVEALTQADVVVYVTSQEKVPVEVLLEWAVIVGATGTPLVCCLNRTPHHAQPAIIADQFSRTQAVAQRLKLPAPQFETIAFEFLDAESSEEVTEVLCDPGYQPGAELRKRVLSLIGGSDGRRERIRAAADFVCNSLETALAPAKAEVEAIQQWETAVQTALDRFIEDYRKNYLDQEDRYDAFKKVSLKILDLLNPPVPGLKPALKGIRWALYWPSKVILMIGRRLYDLRFGKKKEATDKKKLDPEQQTYQEAHVAFLVRLGQTIQTECKKPQHHPFWDELDSRWTEDLPGMHDEFDQALKRHADETLAEINRIAQSIYDELAKRPVVLNGLRTGRIASDLGVILLAVVTAGHSTLVGDIVHDVAVAPALMALLEAVSQGVTEGYVNGQKQRLRTKLLADARSFTSEIYAPHMRKLAEKAIGKTGILRINREVIESLPQRVQLLADAIRQREA